MDQLLTEKNAVIQALEQRLRQLEKELRLARESADRLRRSLRTLGGLGGGEETADGGDVRAEVLTLHETLDRMSQQLASSLEESRDLKTKCVGNIKHVSQVLYRGKFLWNKIFMG